MLRAVARAGAPTPSPERPNVFLFPGQAPPQVTPLHVPWMLAAIVAARENGTLQRAAAAYRGDGLSNPPAQWTPIAHNTAGAPLVSAAAAGERLVVAVSSPPADLLSVVAVRSALIASTNRPDWNELETVRIASSQLMAWTRPAAPIPPERFKPSAPGDARWLWALALVLLCVEWVLRGERTPVARSEARAA
jgi:hypothetical protein